MRSLLTGVLIALIISILAIAQTANPPQSPSPAIHKTTGHRLYDEHCAFCHGNDAKGGGPFATSLKVWPPDLTTLARKNQGTFPELHVSEVIDGEFEKPSHGSHEMPIWGPVFRSAAHGKKDSAQVRITALTQYIESIQEK